RTGPAVSSEPARGRAGEGRIGRAERQGERRAGAVGGPVLAFGVRGQRLRESGGRLWSRGADREGRRLDGGRDGLAGGPGDRVVRESARRGEGPQGRTRDVRCVATRAGGEAAGVLDAEVVGDDLAGGRVAPVVAQVRVGYEIDFVQPRRREPHVERRV